MSSSPDDILDKLSASHPYLVLLALALPGSGVFLVALSQVMDKLAKLINAVRGKPDA